jgi:UDP-N-acetylglucosamine 4,6-dehydratase/5-epimerase
MHGHILITGGTGTLGRAILRQAQRERWDATFTVTGRSESRLAWLQRRHPKVRTVIADVRDAQAMHAAIAGHDVVIHAAALKRIPECEQQPDECLATNAIGSANVARACQAHRVGLAIGISTDKACRAATVYGASKLMLEGIWRAQRPSDTRFVAVRYGNVVASNGSVIPIWREQSRRGQMVTVTDYRMTRFWMSPTDAVRLIQRAAAAEPGTITIPKMGAMTITDLAETIVPGARLAETGLRSTEKLHEDLVHESEAATEELGGYTLSAAGTLGHRYTSLDCPRLTPDAFRAMLRDAEELEADW